MYAEIEQIASKIFEAIIKNKPEYIKPFFATDDDLSWVIENVKLEMGNAFSVGDQEELSWNLQRFKNAQQEVLEVIPGIHEILKEKVGDVSQIKHLRTEYELRKKKGITDGHLYIIFQIPGEDAEYAIEIRRNLRCERTWLIAPDIRAEK